MKIPEFLKYDEDLKLEKSTVVVLRWIALIGQLITIYVVHFFVRFELPIVLCSITIFFGGITNIFIQFNLRSNQLNNTESSILLFYITLNIGMDSRFYVIPIKVASFKSFVNGYAIPNIPINNIEQPKITKDLLSCILQ